jgi:hypothetical protein
LASVRLMDFICFPLVDLLFTQGTSNIAARISG